VTTIAGVPGRRGFKDGPASQAQFRSPSSLCFDPQGNLVICDSLSNRVRLLNLKTSTVSTLLGSVDHANRDGPADKCSIRAPFRSVCGPSGELFITTNFGVVRKYDALTGEMQSHVRHALLSHGLRRPCEHD
jgi:hypothetical protein